MAKKKEKAESISPAAVDAANMIFEDLPAPAVHEAAKELPDKGQPSTQDIANAGAVALSHPANLASGSWGEQPTAAVAPTIAAALQSVSRETPGVKQVTVRTRGAPSLQDALGTLTATAAPQMNMLQGAAPAEPAPDPILQLIQHHQEQRAKEYADLKASMAPKQPSWGEALSKLGQGVLPVLVGALAGKAAGIGAGSGAGIGAGVGSQALDRAHAEEAAQAKEAREGQREDMRFARQDLAKADEDQLKVLMERESAKRGSAEKAKEFERMFTAEMAKGAQGFQYDKAKIALEGLEKMKQINATKAMELEMKLMGKAALYGQDPAMNKIEKHYGGSEADKKSAVDELQAERLHTKGTAALDQLYGKASARRGENLTPGALPWTEYSKDIKEINSQVTNIFSSLLTIKNGEAGSKYSKERIRDIVEPLLFSSTDSQDRIAKKLEAAKSTLGAIKGESPHLNQIGLAERNVDDVPIGTLFMVKGKQYRKVSDTQSEAL